MTLTVANGPGIRSTGGYGQIGRHRARIISAEGSAACYTLMIWP